MAIEGVARQLQKVLDEYIEQVNETSDECMDQTAKETVQDLKQTSPKRKVNGGAYAKSWAVKKEGHRYIVHNKKHYQLTHLLENGHLVKNQYGTYKRWEPESQHIAPAEKRASERLIEKLRQKL